VAAGRTGLRRPPGVVRRRSRRRPLRIVAWVLFSVLVAALIVIAFAVPATIGVRHRLDEGRRALEQARVAVVDGDTGRALDRFRAAYFAFDEAAARSDSGVLGIARFVPVVGANIDVVRALAIAGSDTGHAGIEVAQAVRGLPGGGIAALAPVDGRIPLERFPVLGAALARAHTLVDDAATRVRASSSSFLLPPVDSARWEAETSLDDLAATLGSASTLLERLPAFLGDGGRRRYLFGAENPAELRGTGGLIGAYALMTARDGRLSFSRFLPVQDLPILDVNGLEPPNADYRRLYYPQRGGKGFWLNVNMTPDFPSAARALETAYEAATGKHVDGVLSADPFALRALLQATGPARVPGLGVRVTPDSVVSFLANRAYSRIDDAARRKLILGDVARTIVGRFLREADAARSVRAVGDAAAEGHVLVYSNDPALEAALSMTGTGGAFRPTTETATDILSVVANNAAGNKVDYYMDRDVRYTVTLDDGGGAHGDAAVRLTNNAPTSGVPAYVLGPHSGVTTKPGQNLSIVNVYCGACELSRATRDGTPFDPGSDHELSSNFFQDYVRVDSGAATTSRYEYRLSSAWTGDSTGGSYRLRFLNQPTIRPTTLEVEIRVPDGMHVTDASSGVRVSGGVATWSGTPSRTLTIDLAFAPPLPQRFWRQLIH
jgi:hypothetical protein